MMMDDLGKMTEKWAEGRKRQGGICIQNGEDKVQEIEEIENFQWTGAGKK